MAETTRGRSREQAIETAAELFAVQGFAATGVAEVIERSGTPKGSFYFNFPGGKEELGVEALTAAGGNLEAGINLLAGSASSPAAFLDLLVAGLAAGLEASDFARGCPIATVALETATTSEPMRDAAAVQFSAWQEAIARGISGGSKPKVAERRTAGQILMLLEGALLMARVRRSTEPVIGLKPTLRKLISG
jgi:TetR/AcrR family transcriptional repressor of lmrAB and yxaGH operons